MILTGSLLAGLSVAIGAFAAHGLKSMISAPQLLAIETAVRYQMFHALAILWLALYLERNESKLLSYAFYAFVGGIVFFSGSIYLLSTRELTQFQFSSWLGPVTPVGGLCLLAGWALVFYSVLRKMKQK